MLVVTLTDESLNDLITPAQRAEIISLQKEYERLIRIYQSASLYNGLLGSIPAQLILALFGRHHLTNAENYQEVCEKILSDNPTIAPADLQFSTPGFHQWGF